MTLATNTHFLQTIRHLREQEEMLIYDRLISTTGTEEEAVGVFLQEEYEKEIVGYPGYPPPFEQEAAVWAAKIVFNASQLLLSRDQNNKDLGQLLTGYRATIDAAAILSADLCLRCLPDVITKAREINPDDGLIPLLEEVLQTWHYSGVGYFKGGAGGPGMGEKFDWTPVLANDCLRRLYIDRVIGRRAAGLANSPALRSEIRAALGDHSAYFWKELQQYDESNREIK